jgi:hypothetical protein
MSKVVCSCYKDLKVLRLLFSNLIEIMKTIVSRKLDYFSYLRGKCALIFFAAIFVSIPRVQGFKMYLFIEGNVKGDSYSSTIHPPKQRNESDFVGLGQLSTYKTFTALVQIYLSTIHKVYPPICGTNAQGTVLGDF